MPIIQALSSSVNSTSNCLNILPSYVGRDPKASNVNDLGISSMISKQTNVKV